MGVVLILVDGMRPDAIASMPQVQKWMEDSCYTLEARTVMPSVTLPCHMSLFHSVTPERHGVTTNTYTPQVRPVRGLCELLSQQQKSVAFFYNWEELRDLARPGSLVTSYFCSGSAMGYEPANEQVTRAAIGLLSQNPPDFTFLYLGDTDEVGHRYGWMSEPYLRSVEKSWALIDKVSQVLTEEDTVIITADHGGHQRGHGSELPEDMTIPLFLRGKRFTPGKMSGPSSILDLAPTVAALLGIAPDRDWEGKSLL